MVYSQEGGKKIMEIVPLIRDKLSFKQRQVEALQIADSPLEIRPGQIRFQFLCHQENVEQVKAILEGGLGVSFTKRPWLSSVSAQHEMIGADFEGVCERDQDVEIARLLTINNLANTTGETLVHFQDPGTEERYGNITTSLGWTISPRKFLEQNQG